MCVCESVCLCVVCVSGFAFQRLTASCSVCDRLLEVERSVGGRGTGAAPERTHSLMMMMMMLRCHGDSHQTYCGPGNDCLGSRGYIRTCTSVFTAPYPLYSALYQTLGIL